MIYKKSFDDVGDTYQYYSILSGQEGRVFYFEIPENWVGFLEKIYISQIALCYSTLIIDKGFNKIIYTSPVEFKPPVFVKENIEVRSNNGTATPQLFEVYIKGFACNLPYEIKKRREEISVG